MPLSTMLWLRAVMYPEWGYRWWSKRLLFQLQVKLWGEYKENSELCKNKDKYVHLEPLWEPGLKSLPKL